MARFGISTVSSGVCYQLCSLVLVTLSRYATNNSRVLLLLVEISKRLCYNRLMCHSQLTAMSAMLYVIYAHTCTCVIECWQCVSCLPQSLTTLVSSFNPWQTTHNPTDAVEIINCIPSFEEIVQKDKEVLWCCFF